MDSDTRSRPRETAYHAFLILLVLGALAVGGHFVFQTIGRQSALIIDDMTAESGPQYE